MPNYGRKYITMSLHVKLYFSFFWTYVQNIGLGAGAKRDSSGVLMVS